MSIDITPFIPQDGNCTVAWKRALAAARAAGDSQVFFPRGTYDFFAEGCTEKYCLTSNNDSSVKKIVFALENLDGFQLVGDNADFVFRGRLCAIRAFNCSNLTLKGFSIDFTDRSVCECTVLKVTENTTEIQITEGQFWKDGDRLRFFDDPYDFMNNSLGFIQFDPVRREICQEPIRFGITNRIIPTDGDTVLLPKAFGKPGDLFAFKHQPRLNPGIILDHCQQVSLEDVAIYSSGGMGVLGQLCSDISLKRLTIDRKPGTSRLVSVSDDCIHFVDCGGEILIDSCVLRHSLDDAINIHGIYRNLMQRTVGDYTWTYLLAGHFQQFGLEPARPGDPMEFIRKGTLKPYFVGHVKDVNPNGIQQYGITFQEPLPEDYDIGDVVRDLAFVTTKAVVRNCVIAGNRPRGVLMTNVKEGIIENNTIHTPGAGVFIAGTAEYWFEAGPVENLVIRNNTFDNCCYMHGATGRAAITIAPDVPKETPDLYFHKNISIAGNRFIGPTPNAVIANSVEHLQFADDNTVSLDSSYTTDNPNKTRLALTHCGH